MKIGVIIVFHNNEKTINTAVFIEQLNQGTNLELCLVNNDSKDKTYQLLKEIKKACSNVSVVNIKKFKSDKSAVRAGARFMFNQFRLDHLGYVSTHLLNVKSNSLNRLIKTITENQDLILSYNIKTIEKKEIKQTLFQSMFSVIEYLKKIKEEHQFVRFEYQS